VIAINMPSKFNSDTTKDLAKESATNLWIEYKVFPIQESVDLKKKQIQDISGIGVTNFNFENIQARERWQILADYAAHTWWVFTNNGNKTEVALGYATLYWDVAWSFCPIGDLYKTQVYALAKYINKKYGKEMIPEGIINIIPSAELSDNQNVDEWKWDPFNYEYTDKLLFKLVEKRYEPEDILKKYVDGTIKIDLGLENDIEEYFETPKAFIENLEDIFKRLEINFFKRVQSPPIFTISRKSFWFDFREAQNGVYYTRGYKKLKEKILQTK
jgi:NAD+ synthase (glutamine-hydrolysing)